MWVKAFYGVTALCLLLVLTVGGIAFYYSRNPISNQFVHKRIIQRLERITGLSVSYQSADLNIPTGFYTINNLRLSDPADPSNVLLAFAQLKAEVNPVSLLRGKESVINSVVLSEPSRLDFHYTTAGLKPGRSAGILLEAVRKAQGPAGRADELKLPFSELTIEGAQVGLIEQQEILPGLDEPEPEALVSGTVLVTNDEERGIVVGFEGQADGFADAAGSTRSLTHARGVSAQLHISDSQHVMFEANMTEARVAGAFTTFSDAVASATNLRVTSTIELTSPSFSMQSAVSADTINLAVPSQNVNLGDREFSSTLKFSRSGNGAGWKVDSLRVESQSIEAVGHAITNGSDAVSFEVSSSRISGAYLSSLQKFLPAGWKASVPPQGLTAQFAVEAQQREITALTGSLNVKGVTLQTPILPQPVQNLSGKIAIGPDSLKLTESSGEYAGTKFAAEGSAPGGFFASKGNLVDINWSVTSDLDKLLRLAGRYTTGTAHGPLPTGKGPVKATGKYKQLVTLSRMEALGSPEVSGSVQLNEVTVDHPALPAALAGVEGRISIAGERIKVVDVRGKMGGADVVLDGEVTGTGSFWMDPHISATLISRMDLSKVGEYLIPEDQPRLAAHRLSGTAITKMALNGPVVAMEPAEMTGEVLLNQVSFSPNLAFMKGEFTEMDATVRWNGKALDLTEFTGKLNGQQLNGTGAISPEEVSFSLKGGSDLGAIAETFPAIGKLMEMKGPAEFDIRFSTEWKNTAPVSGLGATVEAAAAAVESAVADKTFRLDGTLSLSGTTIRHLSMPPSRKQGTRTVPKGELRDFNATIRIAGDTLSIPHDSPGRGHFSESENCRISGLLQIRRDNFPRIDVRIASNETLNLDSWILGWGKDVPKLDSPPMSGRELDLTVNLSAPSIFYKGQQAGRSRGTVVFKMKHDKSPRVTQFRNVVIEGGQAGLGQVSGSGQVESYVWDPRSYPKWSATVNSQQMPVDTMLAVIFAEPANIRGMITGEINLNGIGSNSRSIRGNGTAYMTNLALGGSRVIQQLGQTTGRNFGGMLFETAQAASFEVGNGALSSRDLALQSSGLMMELRGDYFFEGDPSQGIAPKTVNGMVRMRFFKSVFGSIPIIGQVADLADEVANAFLLAFRLQGTADNPRVTPVPLPLFTGGA